MFCNLEVESPGQLKKYDCMKENLFLPKNKDKWIVLFTAPKIEVWLVIFRFDARKWNCLVLSTK